MEIQISDSCSSYPEGASSMYVKQLIYMSVLVNLIIDKVLYQPFPSNWPEFTCRDKLAYWMESYAENQELVIWTSSYPVPSPKYNAEEKRWSVTVNHDGVLVNLRPAHIVLATSMFGDPIIPILPGSESFGGDIIHTDGFKGGEQFVGKRVVVVGSGNSSADICQDLAFRGASSVTMIQRSPTAVVSDKLLKINFFPAFPPTRPIEYSDLAFQGLPTNALRKLGQEMLPWAKQFDKEMLEGLEKAGFKVSFGPDNSGQLLMVFDRGGGESPCFASTRSKSTDDQFVFLSTGYCKSLLIISNSIAYL